MAKIGFDGLYVAAEYEVFLVRVIDMKDMVWYGHRQAARTCRLRIWGGQRGSGGRETAKRKQPCLKAKSTGEHLNADDYIITF